MLVMDNASIHKSQYVKDLCREAGVELEFLPPYSPDFNPIEATFGNLKAWIKRNYLLAGDFSSFGTFLMYAVEQAGGNHAKEYIRKAGYVVERLE